MGAPHPPVSARSVSYEAVTRLGRVIATFGDEALAMERMAALASIHPDIAIERVTRTETRRRIAEADQHGEVR